MIRFFALILAFLCCGQALAQTPVQNVSQYPYGSTAITASTTGTTGSINVSLAAATGRTTFICGFVAASGGTTAAATVNITVTNTVTGTLNFTYVFVATGQGLLGAALPVCIPASAVNTAITVTIPGGGTGTSVSLSAWGYQL